MAEIEALLDATLDAVKAYVDRSFEAFGAKLSEIEAKFAALPIPRDGKDAEPEAVAAIVARDIRKDIDGLRASVEALPTKAPDLPDIPALIAAAIPPLPNAEQVKAMVDAAVGAIPVPQDGKDADPALVASLVKGEAERILAGWERPQDGKSVTVEELAPLVEDRVQRAVSAIPVPKDGKGMAGMIIDRDGHLVATMTDGTTRDLGEVVGKDADMPTVEGIVDAAVQKAVAALPKAKDGDPGKSVTVDDVAPLIRAEIDKVAGDVSRAIPEAVQAAVAVLPPPAAGKDADPAVIERMVAEAVAALPKPKDGISVDPAEVARMVLEEVEKAIAAIPPAKDGESVDIEQVRAMVAGEVKTAVDAQPKPRDGQDVDMATVKSTIADEVRKAVAALPPAPAGKDADQAAIEARINQEIEKAVSAIRKPEDGHSPTVEEYGPLIREAVQDAVAALPKAKDGVGVAGAILDQKGGLVLTLSDGTIRELGVVMGRNGDDVDMATVEARIKEMFDAWPKPKDGVDSLVYDDVEEAFEDDGRLLVRRLKLAGEVVKEIRHQTKMPIWRGPFDRGREYQPGDMATWNGSVWHCNKPSKGQIGSDGWSLAVKKGKDAPEGEKS